MTEGSSTRVPRRTDPREQILAFVTSNPGEHIRIISRRLKLPIGVVGKGIEELVSAAAIFGEHDGDHTRYFRKGANPRSSLHLKDGLDLPEDFRLIGKQDAHASITTGVPLLDQFTMSDYIEWNEHPESAVIARDLDGRMVGLVHVIAADRHLLVDKLARLIDGPKGTGALLLKLVETHVAPHARVRLILLDALGSDPRLREWYKDRGYKDSGEPVNDPEWGLLYPMKKRLA